MRHGGSRRRRRKMAERELQTAGFLDDAYDTIAGTADHLAGSTDEAVARTFDDEQGGGVFSGIQETVPLLEQSEQVTERQVEEGVLDESRSQSDDVAASSASIQRTDNSGPPNGRAVQIVRIGNGLARVPQGNPNRRPTDALDVASPTGAAIGVGTAAATIGGAAAAGAIATPAGSVIAAGLAAGGLAGTYIASEIEEAVGALGYTITGFIDGDDVGQRVTSVGVPAAGVGQRTKDVEFEHALPSEPGEYTLRIVVSMWQTGDVVNTIEVPITVEEGASSNTASDINQDQQDDGGDSSGGGFNLISFASENPGLAALTGIGGLVAINSFAGNAGETIVQ